MLFVLELITKSPPKNTVPQAILSPPGNTAPLITNARRDIAMQATITFQQMVKTENAQTLDHLLLLNQRLSLLAVPMPTAPERPTSTLVEPILFWEVTVDVGTWRRAREFASHSTETPTCLVTSNLTSHGEKEQPLRASVTLYDETAQFATKSCSPPRQLAMRSHRHLRTTL